MGNVIYTHCKECGKRLPNVKDLYVLDTPEIEGVCEECLFERIINIQKEK